MVPLAIRLVCFVLLAASPARADVFHDLSGRFGKLAGPNTCAQNPHVVTFSEDRSQAHFVWAAPIIDFRGVSRMGGSYVILSHDDQSVTMRIPEETRLTDTGETVVWIMRRVTEPEGYCWGRTDWPVTRCEQEAVRCAPDPAIS